MIRNLQDFKVAFIFVYMRSESIPSRYLYYVRGQIIKFSEMN